jgi:hypothetical protein
MGLLALFIGSAATGWTARVFDALFVSRTTASGLGPSADDMKTFHEHLTEARMNVEEWRRDQEEMRRYRERLDERTARIERKIDLIAYKLRVSTQGVN